MFMQQLKSVITGRFAPAGVPKVERHVAGEVLRAPIRPQAEDDLPQHLTLPAEPCQILAFHPLLNVLVCRKRGFGGISLYADGWDVTDEFISVSEATFLCTGPAELVRKVLKEKFNVEL